MSVENLFIWIAIFFSVNSFLFGLVSVIKSTGSLKKVSYRSYVAALFFILLSICFLAYRLLIKDFTYDYVVSHLMQSDQLFTSLLAIFSGKEGVFLSFVATYALISLFMLSNKYIYSIRSAYVLSSSSILFLFLLSIIMYATPFSQSFPAVTDGLSLDRIAINLAMLINYITMFCGYAFVATTFSFVTAYAINGRKSHVCFSDIVFRLSALSLLFLTIANGLNMYWSYKTVDLGGYWSWTISESLSLVSWIFSGVILSCSFLLKNTKEFSIYNSFCYFFAFASVLFCFYQADGFFPFYYGVRSTQLKLLMYAVPFYFVAHLTIMSFSKVVIQKIEIESIKKEYFADTHFVIILFVIALSICAGVILPIISSILNDAIVVSSSYYQTMFMAFSGYFLLLSYFDTREPWLKKVTSLKYYLFDWWAIFLSVFILVWLINNTGTWLAPLILCFAALNVFKFISVYVATIMRLRRKGVPLFLSLFGVFWEYPFLYSKYLIRTGLSIFCIGVILSSMFMHEKSFVISETKKSNIGNYYLKFNGVSTTNVESGFKKQANIVLESSGGDIIFLPQKFYENINSVPINIPDVKSIGKYDVFICFFGFENGILTGIVKMVPYVKVIWLGVSFMVIALFLMLYNKRKLIYL